MDGNVERTIIAPAAGEEMQETNAVDAVAGQGLREDRYFREIETGTFVGWEPGEERPNGYDVTLIEQEAIEAIEREANIELEPGEHRRNIETRGVALNHLVSERFRIGEVICRGDRLCEPCDYLETLTEDGTLDALVHRGGLRADIVGSGDRRSSARERADRTSPLQDAREYRGRRDGGLE